MEAINDSSKAIAKALELLKKISFPPHIILDDSNLRLAIHILEEGLTKITDKMGKSSM